MSSPLDTTDDRQLWQAIRQGDKTAFSILYRRHIQALLNYGLKHTGDKEIIKDTLQELFSEMWKNRTSLNEVQHVKFYLLKAFRYKLLRALSKTIHLYSLEELFSDIPVVEETNMEYKVEHLAALKVLVSQLPERQQEVIHLKYYQQLSNSEIAEVINVNYQSVSNLLYRAVLKLQALAKTSVKK